MILYYLAASKIYTSDFWFQVLYNIGKVKSDAGDVTKGVVAYREAIR